MRAAVVLRASGSSSRRVIFFISNRKSRPDVVVRSVRSFEVNREVLPGLNRWDRTLPLMAQEEDSARPWQLVTKKYWWREKKASQEKSQRLFTPHRPTAEWFQR
jgi:hypothetical protein